ncbi:hypothetical protein B0H14DRAFT_2796668 [Mycena olivaceomarginata]|nr:hypothetical protein B0H14DRAFT_2930371 [Mycena olivaceomarginata]KAJ7835362.1 hypothetical protein B0H14DRAFT_2796668 [Mycena olivaceomarginata]
MRLSVICPFLCGLFRATSSFPILPERPVFLHILNTEKWRMAWIVGVSLSHAPVCSPASCLCRRSTSLASLTVTR